MQVNGQSALIIHTPSVAVETLTGVCFYFLVPGGLVETGVAS